MLKVFLVEDEFVMREGIKNNIDWNAHGYEFCGEAADGEVAFPMIQKLKPDIVITDIRMPFMDGLELSKLIKKEMPWIEIIILTGFEEFAYAKEAIKIGVAQYLSKPISGDELIQELNLLSDKITEKKRDREIQEQYNREMEENNQKNRKDFFQDLVSGEQTPANLHEMAEQLEIDISAMWYNIVLFQLKLGRNSEEIFSNRMVSAEEEIRRWGEKYQLLIFDRGLEGMAVLFKGDSEEEIQQLQNEYMEQLEKILSNYKDIKYFGGIGRPVKRLRELPESFESARIAFAHRYLLSESTIISSEAIQENEEEFDIENVNPKQVDRTRILEFLKLGDKEETRYFVDEFFKEIGKNAIQSNIFRQYIVMDAYFCVKEFVENLELSSEQITPPDFTSGELKDEEGARGYVTSVIYTAVTLREQTANDRYRGVVSEVMHYIEENYGDEDLSLNQVAAHVNFSPNHLSTIFSQQTDQTFIKYLTDYRMSKAKELLRCTGDKSSVISMKVGYKDPHYFSYLFKKTQGMTPTQYRGNKNTKGE